MKVVTDSRTCFQVWKINFGFRHHILTDDVTVDKELFFQIETYDQKYSN